MTTLQKIILGAFLYGVSIQDIAKVLKMPTKVVEARLREAIRS